VITNHQIILKKYFIINSEVSSLLGEVHTVPINSYLKYSRTLDRRDFVEIEFSGHTESVYSEISPVINITN